jgi:hypothetical protein
MSYESELPNAPKTSATTLESAVEDQFLATLTEFSAWIDIELQSLEDKYANQITKKSLAVSLKRG